MTINYILGAYILLDKKRGLYFSGRTRKEVIEKALYYLSIITK
jgi:hypothetical protein